jgi:hypothetical protein
MSNIDIGNDAIPIPISITVPRWSRRVLTALKTAGTSGHYWETLVAVRRGPA